MNIDNLLGWTGVVLIGAMAFTGLGLMLSSLVERIFIKKWRPSSHDGVLTLASALVATAYWVGLSAYAISPDQQGFMRTVAVVATIGLILFGVSYVAKQDLERKHGVEVVRQRFTRFGKSPKRT